MTHMIAVAAYAVPLAAPLTRITVECYVNAADPFHVQVAVVDAAFAAKGHHKSDYWLELIVTLERDESDVRVLFTHPHPSRYSRLARGI